MGDLASWGSIEKRARSGHSAFVAVPLEQQGGIEDHQYRAGIVDQGAADWIKDLENGQQNGQEVEPHGKGKIEIEYYSDKELERMFDMIVSLGKED